MVLLRRSVMTVAIDRRRQRAAFLLGRTRAQRAHARERREAEDSLVSELAGLREQAAEAQASDEAVAEDE